MSKKNKKLISGLLALAMVASSGVAVLADEPTTTAAEAGTTATEATAAPAEETPATEVPATEEPAEETPATEAPVVDKYADDAYYQKALALCKSLGVITGYDDGSVKPESTVTRAEMAAIILRMTAATSTSKYRNIFDDVTTSHWAADTIQTAADAKYINGMGDGTFNPDGDVQYEQAVKMVVCGMNYDYDAQIRGGYPEGYISVASVNLKLLNGLNAKRGTAIERGEIIKMVYNALLGPYHKITAYADNGAPIYDTDDDETLAKAKFDVYEEKGLLTGTSNISITSSKPTDGQITIDGQTFLCSIPEIDDYVAKKVTYYYRDNGKDDEEVVAVSVDTSKTTEATVNAADIDKISDITSADGYIETEDGKRYKTENAYVIYNGDYINEALYNAAVKADTANRFNKIGYDGVDTGSKLSYNEFITPEAGDVKLVDNDGNGKYDVVFINSAETMRVTAATDKKVIGNIKKKAVTLDVDTEANADLTVTVTKDGDDAKAKNLKKNEVVSVYRNLTQDTIKLEQVSNTITGKIASVTAATASDSAYATVNGTEYEIDINAIDDCTVGLDATLSLDKFDRIGYVETETLISSSEQYGWIMNSYQSDSGAGYEIKLFAQDGSFKNYSLAKNVDYWAPGATESQSLSTADMSKALKNISYNTASNGVEIRLVKFGTNSKGEISKLYVAQALKSGLTKGSSYSSTTYDKKSLVVEPTDLTGKVSSGNLIESYYMSDGMLEFVVPNNNSSMSDNATYAVNKVSASAYLDKENGSSKNFIVGEYSDDKQTYPTIVIRFEGSDDDAKLVTDYGTADNNPCFMLDKILTGVDEDDNTVYTLVGYRNGGQVKYTTKKNSTFAKLAGEFTGTGNRDYNATKMWDAVNGMSSEGKTEYPNAKTLTDMIEPGDIIGVAGNGNVLILMVDASELASQIKNNSFDDKAYAGASSGRDSLYIGRVQDSDLGENAVMTVSGRRLLFDAGNAMDTAVINEAGAVSFSTEDVSTIADVIDFNDDTNTGDYAFARYANKGTLQEVFIYRFD